MPCLPSCLYSWWSTFKSSRHVFLNQSQGSALLSPQLPHLWAAHQENTWFLSLSNLRTNFPQPHFGAFVDFSRISYFHLPPWERSNFRGMNRNLTELQHPLSMDLRPPMILCFISHLDWFRPSWLGQGCLIIKRFIFSLGEDTNPLRNMGEL